MTDENTSPEQDEAPANDTAVRRLSTILLLAIVIIAIILLWRSCDNSGTTETSSTAEKSIGAVEGLNPSPGDVTVWLRDGVSIEDVLARHNLSAEGLIEFPGGTTYSISIGNGDPEEIVAELKQDPDLYDAGYLFVDE